MFLWFVTIRKVNISMSLVKRSFSQKKVGKVFPCIHLLPYCRFYLLNNVQQIRTIG